MRRHRLSEGKVTIASKKFHEVISALCLVLYLFQAKATASKIQGARHKPLSTIHFFNRHHRCGATLCRERYALLLYFSGK
jgi:hypothetical protein